MHAPVPWYRSIAVKSFAIAFIATHLPLVVLGVMIAMHPEAFTPAGVLLAALAATLCATVLVIFVLWRLFRPLRTAADGLRDFMVHGQPLRMTPGSADEVGRLVRMLVLSLAHLDRGRAALLQAGAHALEAQVDAHPGATSLDLDWMALIEIDQWQQLDERADLVRMQEVQQHMSRLVHGVLLRGETLLHWGRGRFLVVLGSSGADCYERMEKLKEGFRVGSSPQLFTCSIALEGRTRDSTGWTSALQRLEYKLFSMRMEGGTAGLR
ncbi:MAG: hypothetical protein ABW051_00280 [Burkholderiaceae bacterium]